MFLLKDNPSEKVVIVEKEPDGIGNLEDLPRLVFIEKECGNLNYSLMVETLLEILTKRSQMFYKPIDVRSVTDDMGETASSISIRIIVNQLEPTVRKSTSLRTISVTVMMIFSAILQVT